MTEDTLPASPDSQRLTVMERLRGLLAGKSDSSLRDVLEDYLENSESAQGESSAAQQERTLIANILKLRDMPVVEVMVPRADIVGVELRSPPEALLSLLAERRFSRIPVYRNSLDDITGIIDVRDILARMAQGQPLVLSELAREATIVSPTMRVLDLLVMMRQTRNYMALVVDEYGGIDGLVSIGDLIEAIIGEIYAEGTDAGQRILERPDGTYLADGRLDIDTFSRHFHAPLTEEEREDSDTLGGLIASLAGRVPARGEVITHETSGRSFTILEADPRRIRQVIIHPLVPAKD